MEGFHLVKKTFQTILLFLSIGFFTFHVKGVIEESLEKKTTVATTQVHFTHLSPPPITLCPGQVINHVKLKKKYGCTFDIFTPNPFVNKSDHLNVKSRTPLELFMDISYVLGKDLEIAINTYNDTQVESNILLKIGTNQIHDAWLGDFSVILEEVVTGYTNGLCYKITTNVSLSASMTSIFGFFLQFKVPSEEYPDMFRGFMDSEFDYTALNYKFWPGTKPFAFEIRIQESNVISVEQKIWNFYRHNQQRRCLYYPTSNESYMHCFAKNLISHLASERNCNSSAFFCSSPKWQTFVRLANNESLTRRTTNCQSLKEEEYLAKSYVPSFVHAESQCQVPCNVTEYQGQVRRMALTRPGNLTYVGIINESNTVTYFQEVLIYDMLTFIGSVGGSLGLFIGFSFYDFGLAIGQFLCRRLYANRNKSSQEGNEQNGEMV